MTQISKNDESGYWLNICELESCDSDLPTIKLIPMVHVAEKDFFEAAKLEHYMCDIALYEGAFLRTRGILRLIYRILKGGKRLALSYQNDRSGNTVSDSNCENTEMFVEYENGPQTYIHKCKPFAEYPEHEKFSRTIRYIRADLGAKGTQGALKSVPFWFWIVCSGFLLGMALFGRLFMSRKILSELLDEPSTMSFIDSVDDLDLPEWLANHARTLTRYVTTERDEYLKKILDHEIQNNVGKDRLIGVQYGAGHMPVLIDWLVKRRGYSLVESKSMLAIPREISSENEMLEKQYEVTREAYQDRMSALYFAAYPAEGECEVSKPEYSSYPNTFTGDLLDYKISMFYSEPTLSTTDNNIKRSRAQRVFQSFQNQAISSKQQREQFQQVSLEFNES